VGAGDPFHLRPGALMEFAILTRWAALLFNPGNLLVLVLAAGALLLFTRWRRAGRWLVAAAALACVLLAFLPVSAFFARTLEDQYPRPALPAHITGILVLSGGISTGIYRSRGVAAPDPNTSRILAAAALMRRYPQARAIYSGGIAPVVGGTVPEAAVAREIFADAGIAPSRLVWESRSRNTAENFRYARAIAHPLPGDRWVVVASALQMPRAMAIARRQCWPVIPWPSDYVSAAGPLSWINFGFAGNLELLGMDLHEGIGRLAYGVTGRTGACTAPG
jgi:uncharacterized SAM-binding protein YcdF (DUF218 family)